MMGKRQNITPFFTDQKLLLKSMTPEKKINLTLSLYYSAKKLKYFERFFCMPELDLFRIFVLEKQWQQATNDKEVLCKSLSCIPTSE